MLITKTNKTLSSGANCWFVASAGEVLATKEATYSTVHQTSSTLVAGVGDKSNAYIPGEVYSVTHNKNEVWLRFEDGREKSFELGSFGLPMRVGHKVCVVHGNIEGEEFGSFLVARNITTGESRSENPRYSKQQMSKWGIRKFQPHMVDLIAGVIGFLWGASQHIALGVVGGFFAFGFVFAINPANPAFKQSRALDDEFIKIASELAKDAGDELARSAQSTK